MRTPLVAGNWKMNKTLEQSEALLTELAAKRPDTSAEIIVAPPFLNLPAAVRQLQNSVIGVAAQNMHQAESGAYTGEVSADMLLSVGVRTVILGHSERRSYFGESDELLKEKVDQALAKDLQVIFCFGEELGQRKSGSHFEVVERQLREALFHLDASQWKSLVLAYEPVWAIGTGETASPAQAQEMHAFIRQLLAKEVGAGVADAVRILYGGSVKPANAEEIFSQPDVDGGLIGGASLKADDFVAIIAAAG
ncbi:triose-phosphate isomerase [Aureicoccus marinus]|uniref:Triosephosphate isomerase n=1 Tax=Aureicoccus marinus TaxID=754435 RepID=A0A2S7T4Y5_9FLAO|nr:triose-phosphate isomerase [Aureicoccus marinus]PQJ14545.1 triose-phosphate isomerase [Aureicoccus marinus]